MKVAVTGATGFVGSALMPYLRAADLTPVAVGRAQVDDIGPDTDWKPFLESVEAVVHLAAMVHVRAPTPEQSAQFHDVNALATEKLARDAAEAGVRRMVFLSTSKVMGDVDIGSPITERDKPSPRGPYASSKLEAEARLFAVQRETALETVILRPPLVYGPGVGGNFRSLLRLCATPWPLPFGSVENRRSLVSVRNLCDAIMRSVKEPAAVGLTAFVTDGVDISTRDLVKVLRESMGLKPRLVPLSPSLMSSLLHFAGRDGVADRLFSSFTLSSARFREAIGWSAPQRQAGELQEVADWFRKLDPVRE